MEDYVRSCIQESVETLNLVCDHLIGKLVIAADVVARALQRGNKVLFFGNGGSAADSQHLAAEFVNRFMIERPPLPAIALTTDTSIITSISNDYSFGEVFAKQIKALGLKGDVAVAISTSGSSTNVIRAVRVAKRMDIYTIGLTSTKGEKLIDLVDLPIPIPSESTPRIQEAHILVGHILCDLTDMMLFKNIPKNG